MKPNWKDKKPEMKATGLVIGILAIILSDQICLAEAGEPTITPEFAKVLRTGDCDRLQEALNGGMPVNGRDAAGNTPLMEAAVYGNVACMRLLLDRGAQVNTKNEAGATPLIRAAYDFEKVRLLVESGADVEARSGFGDTALMLAARPWNGYQTVELLIGRGAEVNATNNWGATALMAAAASGNEKSVRLLLKNGADPNAQPGTDHGGFIFGGGRSALMWASFRGDVGIMKLLIDAGAKVNAEGFLGTPLVQAAWGNQTAAARLLIEKGAQVDQVGRGVDFSALHWAASSEQNSASLVKLLLEHGANPNLEGGAQVDAFMDVSQTPLLLARKRGNTPILSALLAAGATNETPERVSALATSERRLPEHVDSESVRSAIAEAVPLLQLTALESKQAFLKHASKQDCTSCHQQYLPLAASGLAKKRDVKIDAEAERELVKMVSQGELKTQEIDWQALFHPDAAYTKGYTLLAFALQDLPACELTDGGVHHLSVIQAQDGRWLNNLPRPPIQTGDIGATALGINALQHYPLPGRKAEFSERVERARRWLATAKPENNEGRIYQLLGLAWAGEPVRKLQPLAKALIAQQREDGGWSQLPSLKSDAYATGQALYALRVGTGLGNSDPAIERGRRYLLQTQLEDGSWHVHRRAFPFQPTMKSGFPHGRDSWISAAGTSWAVMALSLPEEVELVARGH
jgi:ankyrin repeat protein